MDNIKDAESDGCWFIPINVSGSYGYWTYAIWGD
jgi:hypothetical protein